ncbi:isochorismate synthase [Puniceibacterium sediminis]|uniref:isochorismate synthase n=1 Tax=Puniceibacterium sediminis TaxID=1608407 RepID=A0A238ZG26_9RHOB|nr:isochorismate synthase [Puniceibacterium sediminis]SNR82456.1 isochorismate synthase [Puniceibacterium sediminis]
MAEHKVFENFGRVGTPTPVPQKNAPFRMGAVSGVGHVDAGLTGVASNLAALAGARLREPGAPDLLVGALPFDRKADGFLLVPETVYQNDSDVLTSASAVPEHDARSTLSFSEVPPRAHYADAVAQALIAITAGEVDKVVLARTLDVTGPQVFDIAELVTRLAADASTMLYCLPLPDPGATLVGASPELLVSRSGRVVRSHPLAGSARRRRDADADRSAAAGLEASAKDAHEHALVAEHVRDILAPFCRKLSRIEAPKLSATPAMWHLGSMIEGELKDPDTPVLDLTAALHPTPAVCGSPTNAADAAIARLETEPRGFYAGAVGWTNERGEGAWHVTIRCAVVRGAMARLYAGAGIVAGSDPMSEADETAAKFGTLLAAFGLSPRLLLQGANR